MGRRTPIEANQLAQFLANTARGDRSAFEALYRGTSTKLFGIILRMVSERSVAEEVLQETYVRIWRNADSFAAEAGQPIAWLSAIARNSAIDRLRSNRLSRAQVDDGDTVLARLATEGEGDPVTRNALRTCLQALEPDARECVLLAYCYGFSRDELAERFSRPIGTIKSLLHRTVLQLRTCLDRE